MKNFAWINTDNNLVENVIYYDGETPLALPDNIKLIEIPDGYMGSWGALGIGWKYVYDRFVEPPKPVYENSTPATIIPSIGGAPNVIA